MNTDKRALILIIATFQFLPNCIKENADLYILHSPELLPLGILLKLLGKKVVYDAHEDLPRHILEKETVPKILRKPLSRLSEAFLMICFRLFNGIISPHKHIISTLISNNITSELIANFPLVRTLSKIEKEEFLKRRSSLCYCGTVYEYSNQEMILRSLGLIDKTIEYNIAGYIDDKYKNKLLGLKESKQLQFHGRIKWDDLPIFFDRSIAGMCIYDYKLNLGGKLGCFGTNKIFEYMEAGLPVICTDYTLWKKIIDEHKCGYVVAPGDINILKSIIEKLTNDKSLAYEMGQNGQEAIRKKYNWDSEEKKLINFVEKIIDGKN